MVYPAGSRDLHARNRQKGTRPLCGVYHRTGGQTKLFMTCSIAWGLHHLTVSRWAIMPKLTLPLPHSEARR
jgi:hypothetical protein